MKKNYVVFRIEKLKSQGQIITAINHNYRFSPPANADPNKKFEILFGENNPKGIRNSISTFVDNARGLNKDKHGKIKKLRSDAVLCCEGVLSASRDFFKENPDNLKNWVNSNLDFLKKEFPGLCSVSLHLDESTPHIHFLAVPIDKDGKLNAKKVVGGKDTMREWQDKAYEAVKHLNIKRGIDKRGTGAEHTRIKQYYENINRPLASNNWVLEDKSIARLNQYIKDFELVKDSINNKESVEKGILGGLKLSNPPPLSADKSEFIKYAFTSKEKHSHLVDVIKVFLGSLYYLKRLIKVNSFIKSQVFSDKVREKLRLVEYFEKAEENAMNFKNTLDVMKQKADEARGLSIINIVKSLGGVEKESKPGQKYRKFKLNNHNLSLNTATNRFYDNATNKSGGVIDLVMLIQNMEFTTALNWLMNNSDFNKFKNTFVKEGLDDEWKIIITSMPPSIPEENKSNFENVFNWLTKVRKFNSDLIRDLFNKGLLYADNKNNAVFLRRPANNQVEGCGYFVRGTSGNFKQTLGGQDYGLFEIIEKNPEKIYVCESVTSALALKTLYPKCSVVARGGNLFQSKQILEILGPRYQNSTLIGAFDNDEKGRKFAQEFADLGLKNAEFPEKFKDWGDFLINERQNQKNIPGGKEKSSEKSMDNSDEGFSL